MMDIKWSNIEYFDVNVIADRTTIHVNVIFVSCSFISNRVNLT